MSQYKIMRALKNSQDSLFGSDQEDEDGPTEEDDQEEDKLFH